MSLPPTEGGQRYFYEYIPSGMSLQHSLVPLNQVQVQCLTALESAGVGKRKLTIKQIDARVKADRTKQAKKAERDERAKRGAPPPAFQPQNIVDSDGDEIMPLYGMPRIFLTADERRDINALQIQQSQMAAVQPATRASSPQ